jgi:Phage Terminase
VPKPLTGRRRPAYRHAPSRAGSAGPEAVALLEEIGIELDPWQSDVLRDAMGRDGAGNWVADEVVEVVPRQNGKTVVLLARALWDALLGDERLVVCSAHQFKTARESFLALKSWCETPALAAYEPVIRTGAGNESVEFPGRGRIQFIARSRTSGRGFSPDCAILDEAFELDDLALDAVKPSLAAAKAPQMWFASSAPHPTSSVLRRLCLRGRAGEGERLVYHEWCADADCQLDDPRAWAQANPALGRRLTVAYTRSELDALDSEGFARERLGRWNEDEALSIFPAGLWASLADPNSRASGDKAIAVDVSPDRRRSVIAAAGELRDGRILVEILAEREGVSWVVDEVAALEVAHHPGAVVVDGAGQAESLIAPLEKAGVRVTRTGPREMAAACGGLHDAVLEGRLVHMGDAALNGAVEGATQRTLGDAWAWSRRSSRANVSPLVGASLAHWAVAGGHLRRPFEILAIL